MMKVGFFVSTLFKRFMQLIRKLRLKLKVEIKLSKIKTLKLEEIDMRNLSQEEAIKLAKEFESCKTLKEQKKFCKDHDIKITFAVIGDQPTDIEGKEGVQDGTESKSDSK